MKMNDPMTAANQMLEGLSEEERAGVFESMRKAAGTGRRKRAQQPVSSPGGPGIGSRECARRRNQIERGTLKVSE